MTISSEKPDALVGSHVTRSVIDRDGEPGHKRIVLRFVVESAQYVGVRIVGKGWTSPTVDLINIYDDDADQTRVHRPGDLAREVDAWIAGHTPAELIHNVTQGAQAAHVR